MAVDNELNWLNIGSERSSYFNDLHSRQFYVFYLGNKCLSLY
jgi:hypothetical protein